MRFLVLVFAAVLTGASIASEGLLKRPGDWMPYVENISHGDFLVIESKLGETLSDSCDLVIYVTDGLGLTKSYTLAKVAEGNGYRLELQYYRPEEYSPKEKSKKAVLLPAKISARLLKAFEVTLSKQVYPETGRSWKEEGLFSKSVTTQYIHLKFGLGNSLAGVVALERDVNVSDRPFLEMEYRMRRCVQNDDEDGPPLEKLDAAIVDLLHSYEARR